MEGRELEGGIKKLRQRKESGGIEKKHEMEGGRETLPHPLKQMKGGGSSS